MPTDDVVLKAPLGLVAAQQASREDAFSYSFIEIIDADHAAINRLAGKIRKVLASNTVGSRLPELQSLLLEVTWRLIRHDFSEDMVMRPAFASVLGDYGVEMVERDRNDHAGGRGLLLSILGELDLVGKESDKKERQERLTKVSRMVIEAFDELGEHMKVESGEVLPHFESVITAEASSRLAREYADTLLMTPNLMSKGDDIKDRSGEPVFSGGLKEYIQMEPAELRQRYNRILETARTQEGRLWFDKMTDNELENLRIGKKPTRETKIEPEDAKRSRKSSESKVPTNALGLPVSWHTFRKGRL